MIIEGNFLMQTYIPSDKFLLKISRSKIFNKKDPVLLGLKHII